MDHSFEKDGYEYHFLSIELVPGNWAYDIIVNVVLPKKGQSYATPVFSNHIHEILSNIWKYVGSSFSYSENILVDGKEPVNRGVFISTEKQKEVLLAMREEMKNAKVWTAIGWLTFDVYWRPMREFYELYQVNLFSGVRHQPLKLLRFRSNSLNVRDLLLSHKVPVANQNARFAIMPALIHLTLH